MAGELGWSKAQCLTRHSSPGHVKGQESGTVLTVNIPLLWEFSWYLFNKPRLRKSKWFEQSSGCNLDLYMKRTRSQAKWRLKCATSDFCKTSCVQEWNMQWQCLGDVLQARFAKPHLLFNCTSPVSGVITVEKFLLLPVNNINQLQFDVSCQLLQKSRTW